MNSFVSFIFFTGILMAAFSCLALKWSTRENKKIIEGAINDTLSDISRRWD